MKPLQVLLVNPPIFDFTAFNFWLRPYGMLRVAGRMKDSCRIEIFDYLVSEKTDAWGRGSYDSTIVSKPALFRDIPRRYRRFGRPREDFREFLRRRRFDAALVQTLMTYWYPGVQETIDDLRELQPSTPIVLGGVYASLCPSHAVSLGADLVIANDSLDPLWKLLAIVPKPGVPHWPPQYSGAGVMKLTEGCPFRCTYCSAPLFWPEFSERAPGECLDEFRQLVGAGIRNIAFYDDALLFHAGHILVPFLNEAAKMGIPVSFHTPNALNARFVTAELANAMVRAGFKSFFLGLESSEASWHNATGEKVRCDEFRSAVRYLREAGAQSIASYIIAGHPHIELQQLEFSMRFAHECGARVLLSEFSPVPGTPDSLKCTPWSDPAEPLSHNKTAFAIRRLGLDRLNGLKTLTHRLNAELSPGTVLK